jgi:hypothetical protein
MKATIFFLFLLVAGAVTTVMAVRPAFACTPYSLSTTVPRGYLYCSGWVRLGIVYINGIPHRQYTRKCTYRYPTGQLVANTFYTYCDIR